MTSIKIQKPWGSELKFTKESLPYAGKIITIKNGERLSLQKHSEKIETILLQKGKCLLKVGEKEIEMKPMHGYTIDKNVVHRLTAIETSQIIEVSTPEKGITYRLEDDYDRANEKY